jgi:type IV secretion system protein VirB10
MFWDGKEPFMAGLILLFMLFQGPKNLQVDENDKIMPPLVVPEGTTIPIRLTTRISTKTANDGDGIFGTTLFPITVDNKIVIPVGSWVRGKVTEVTKPGRVKGKGELTLSFQTLVLPSGISIPIYTSLAGVGGSGERKGENTVQGEGSKGRDAGAVGAGAGQGAVIGVIANGGKGGAIGAAGGAAAGVVGVLLTRGQDLVLEPGTTLEFVLDRPIEP